MIQLVSYYGTLNQNISSRSRLDSIGGEILEKPLEVEAVEQNGTLRIWESLTTDKFNWVWQPVDMSHTYSGSAYRMEDVYNDIVNAWDYHNKLPLQ